MLARIFHRHPSKERTRRQEALEAQKALLRKAIQNIDDAKDEILAAAQEMRNLNESH